MSDGIKWGSVIGDAAPPATDGSRMQARDQADKLSKHQFAAHKELDALRAPIVDELGKPLTLAQRIAALRPRLKRQRTPKGKGDPDGNAGHARPPRAMARGNRQQPAPAGERHQS